MMIRRRGRGGRMIVDELCIKTQSGVFLGPGLGWCDTTLFT